MTFAAEVTRAAAVRGKLDPIYQELSDDWTLMLQRMFPVWVMLGPGLAKPGHILLRSRTVYLDSEELLGTREEILAGALERRAILRTYGVGIHEVLHAKHTKLWVTETDADLEDSDDPDEQQLAVDRRLLEEPRMEATGVRELGADTRRGRFVRLALEAAVIDCIVPRLTGQLADAALAGQPITRDMAGRAMTYLQARTHYGIVRPASLAALRRLCTQVLGAADTKALDDLYAKLIWAPDGDNAALSYWAKQYRDIIGPPDTQPHAGGSGGGGAGQPPAVESLKDALDQAIEDARGAQLEQLNEDVDLQQTVAQASSPPSTARTGGGTGASTGRMPDRGVDRPPYPDEVQAANKLAQRLQQALTMGTRRIDKRTPGGRFNGRTYARGRFERATGRPVTAQPWTILRNVAAPIQEPHVALIVDTSGSMSGYEYALGPIAWIINDALRTIGGKLAVGLFGNGAELLSDGSRPLALVPAIKTGGGTAFAGDAIVMCAEQLEMDNPRRPRFVYILSDGGWYDTEAGVRKIRELADLGVPTIHVAIGVEPLSVEAARVSVITDPADSLSIIGGDTVDALRAHGKRRPAAPAA